MKIGKRGRAECTSSTNYSNRTYLTLFKIESCFNTNSQIKFLLVFPNSQNIYVCNSYQYKFQTQIMTNANNLSHLAWTHTKFIDKSEVRITFHVQDLYHFQNITPFPHHNNISIQFLSVHASVQSTHPSPKKQLNQKFFPQKVVKICIFFKDDKCIQNKPRDILSPKLRSTLEASTF